MAFRLTAGLQQTDESHPILFIYPCRQTTPNRRSDNIFGFRCGRGFFPRFKRFEGLRGLWCHRPFGPRALRFLQGGSQELWTSSWTFSWLPVSAST